MSVLHIANIHFEEELLEETPLPLGESMAQKNLFLHLQFLPCLYASPSEAVGVTHLPLKEFWMQYEKWGIQPPKLQLLSSAKILPYEYIESWGASRAVLAWAQERGLSYTIPPWDVVCEVNSKAFSFAHAPKLPHATLLYTEEETKHWIASQNGWIVFKKCLEMSGRGHLILDLNKEVDASQKAIPFLSQEWEKKRPVLAEPWVKRVLDFSTQWELSQQGEIFYLGATLCENDHKGRYRRSSAGSSASLFKEHLPFLEAHKKSALPLLKQIAHKGYFGSLGVDAMLYCLPGSSQIHLHPIVEINARKTMGWACLHIQKRHFSREILTMQIGLGNEELALPSHLEAKNGSKITFKKQLFLQVNS